MPSPRRAVIEHLATHGQITRAEALVWYGVQNLSDLIQRLKRDGYLITKRIERQEGGRRVCRYVYTTEALMRNIMSGHIVIDHQGGLQAPWEE